MQTAKQRFNSSRKTRPRTAKACWVSRGTILLLLVLVVLFQTFLLFPSNDKALLIADGVSSTNLMSQSTTRTAAVLAGSQLKPTNTSVVFVHVGKTGGETIQWRLKLSCQLRKSKRKKARCLEQFENGQQESVLSRSTIGYLHCNKLRPHGSLSRANMLLFSVRDPIDRIISWFQYMHPKNCLPDRPSGACNLKKDDEEQLKNNLGRPWGTTFYQECFPDVNDFIQSLQTPKMHGDIDCSALAIETIQGRGPEGPTNHMFYNYGYYVNRTLLSLSTQNPNPTRVAVVRQESLWGDLKQVEQLLGGTSDYPFERIGPTITHGSEHFIYRAQLQAKIVPVLCCAIPTELMAYAKLLASAQNLDTSQREFSLHAMLSKCEALSLSDLATKCSWNTAQK